MPRTIEGRGVSTVSDLVQIPDNSLTKSRATFRGVGTARGRGTIGFVGFELGPRWPAVKLWPGQGNAPSAGGRRWGAPTSRETLYFNDRRNITAHLNGRLRHMRVDMAAARLLAHLGSRCPSKVDHGKTGYGRRLEPSFARRQPGSAQGKVVPTLVARETERGPEAMSASPEATLRAPCRALSVPSRHLMDRIDGEWR